MLMFLRVDGHESIILHTCTCYEHEIIHENFIVISYKYVGLLGMDAQVFIWVYDDMLAVRFRLLVSAYSCYISNFFTIHGVDLKF